MYTTVHLILVKKMKAAFILSFYVLFVLLHLFFRARSIYERALDVDHRNITIWLKYAEMEMK